MPGLVVAGAEGVAAAPGFAEAVGLPAVVAAGAGLAPGKFRRLVSGKNWVPPGSCYSMAKPTKFTGGVPVFQFIASRHMPSPL